MIIHMYNTQENVVISVRDTGCGIPNDKIECIFDRFSQIEGSLTREHEGSGIGLSIVKALVQMHGGKISALSEHNKGTEFIIELPLKILSEEEAASKRFESRLQDRIQRIQIEFSDIYSLNQRDSVYHS